MGKKPIVRAALLGALCLPILPALAQEAGGILMTFGIDQRLEAGDNLNLETPSEGSSTIATTRLSFGLNSRTQTQALALDLGGAFRIQDTPRTNGTDTGFADPSLRLSYDRQGKNSALNLRATYQESDINALRLSDFRNQDGVIVLPEDFANLTGKSKRNSYGVDVRLQLGQNAPLGFNLSAGLSGINYSGTSGSNSRFADIRRQNVGGEARLRLSPVITGTAGLRYSTYDANDALQTYRTTTTADVGLEYALSSRATLTASVGATEISTEENGLGTTKTNSPVGSMGLVYQMPNGRATADIEASSDNNGASRLNVLLGRSMDLPDGVLSFSLGLTDPEFGNVAAIGSLDWRRDLPAGQITARIDRRVSSSNQDQSRLSTLVSLGYTRDINRLSGLGLDVVYGATEGTTTTSRVNQLDLSATYRYALTSAWDLNTGVKYRVRDEGSAGRAESPSVFVSIGRRFDFRP